MQKKKNEIKVFENEVFGSIRTVVIDGEPWFIAADVCRILEIKNTTDALNKQLEDFEKARLNLGLRGGDTYYYDVFDSQEECAAEEQRLVKIDDEYRKAKEDYLKSLSSL